jgi:hypothetical protein
MEATIASAQDVRYEGSAAQQAGLPSHTPDKMFWIHLALCRPEMHLVCVIHVALDDPAKQTASSIRLMAISHCCLHACRECFRPDR